MSEKPTGAFKFEKFVANLQLERGVEDADVREGVVHAAEGVHYPLALLPRVPPFGEGGEALAEVGFRRGEVEASRTRAEVHALRVAVAPVVGLNLDAEAISRSLHQKKNVLRVGNLDPSLNRVPCHSRTLPFRAFRAVCQSLMESFAPAKPTFYHPRSLPYQNSQHRTISTYYQAHRSDI